MSLRVVAAGAGLAGLLVASSIVSAASHRGTGTTGGEGSTALRVAPVEGALAPDLRGTDGEGDRVALSDLRGRAVLVNFWATWCPACVAELPAIQAVLDHHRADGFDVLAVNELEEAAVARRFLDDLGVEARLVLDPDGSIARLYRVTGLPASFFVDREGVIAKVWYGEMSAEQVEGFAHLALRGGTSPEGREPADLTVLLDPEGPGTLYLLSPVIRCDAGYCANHLLVALHAVPAVLEARGAPQGEGALAIFVRFDPSLGGPRDIVAAFQRALNERPDPVYGSSLAVRYMRRVA